LTEISRVKKGKKMDKSSIIKALRDGVQATSNGVANSVVGDPVDILASGLRYVGGPVGDRPMGGTEWLKTGGFTPPVDEGLPSAIGSGLGQAVGTAAFMPSHLKGLIQNAMK
jgi:hypothetical protein